MLNFARGILISAALIWVCWWVLQGSSTFQTCIQQDQSQTANNHPEDYIAAFSIRADTYRDCLGDFVHDRKDEILVAFTVILAFSTIFLWVATRDLVSGADKTAERQLRAYVNIIRGAIQPHQQPNGIPTVTAQVTLKNSGQTPAYEHRTWIGIRVEEPESFTFEFPELIADLASSIIGPTIESDMTIGFVIGQENLQAVLDGKKRLFVWGLVEYRDAFNHKRVLKFRAANGGWVGDRWPIGPYGDGYEGD